MHASTDPVLRTHQPVVGSTPYQELDAKPGYSQRYSSTGGKVTGVIQFVCGVVALILGSTALFLRLTFSISCIGIWAGVVFFALSGVLGMISSKRRTGVIVGYMVMSILSAIVAFSAASVYVTAMVTGVSVCDFADYIDTPIDTYIDDTYLPAIDDPSHVIFNDYRFQDDPRQPRDYDGTYNNRQPVNYTDSGSDSSYDSVFGPNDDDSSSSDGDPFGNAVGIFLDYDHGDVEFQIFNATGGDDDYVVDEQERYDGPHYYYENELFHCENRQADLAVNSLLVIVLLIEFIVAIVGAAFTCGGVCCCGSSPTTTSINVVPGNPSLIPVKGGWPVTLVQGYAAYPPQHYIQDQAQQKI